MEICSWKWEDFLIKIGLVIRNLHCKQLIKGIRIEIFGLVQKKIKIHGHNTRQNGKTLIEEKSNTMRFYKSPLVSLTRALTKAVKQ